jgi:hypothetical protein
LQTLDPLFSFLREVGFRIRIATTYDPPKVGAQNASLDAIESTSSYHIHISSHEASLQRVTESILTFLELPKHTMDIQGLPLPTTKTTPNRDLLLITTTPKAQEARAKEG